MSYRCEKLPRSSFILLFCVLWSTTQAQVNHNESLPYSLSERVLINIPKCNDTTHPGVVCASFLSSCGSFLLPNSHGNTSSDGTSQGQGGNITERELVTLIHDRGILFYQPREDGRLDLVNQLPVNCDHLRPVGPWEDQFLLLHTNSPRCTCMDPGKRPCPLQNQVIEPLELQGFINYIDGSVTSPVSQLRPAIEREVILVNSTPPILDSTPEEGCTPFENADKVRGKVALIYRGSCFFQTKVANAELAGAIAVIVVNRNDAPLTSMGVTGRIPAVMIDYEEGELFRAVLMKVKEVVIRLGRNVGKILAHPAADLPFGLGSIPLQDIVERKSLSITPHTKDFQWIDRGFALDADRGYLWLFRVDASSTTLVLDLNNGVENVTQLKNYTDFPLLDSVPTFVTRDNNYYGIGVVLEGTGLQIFNVTDLDNVNFVSELPTLGGNTIQTIRNGSVIYMDTLISYHNILVINATNLESPNHVNNFTEILGNGSRVQPTGLYVTRQEEILWVSYSSIGVTVYDIKENPYDPKRVAPILNTTPLIADEYTVGVEQICGYGADQMNAVGININDEGQQEFVQLSLKREEENRN